MSKHGESGNNFKRFGYLFHAELHRVAQSSLRESRCSFILRDLRAFIALSS
ncbi:MAG: hypothetical protein LAT84_14685 [Balneolia bacterium]|nr:hypothetical protein [Balneolia bacterium]